MLFSHVCPEHVLFMKVVLLVATVTVHAWPVETQPGEYGKGKVFFWLLGNRWKGREKECVREREREGGRKKERI